MAQAHAYWTLYALDAELPQGDFKVIRQFRQWFRDGSPQGGAALLAGVDLARATSVIFDYSHFAQAVRAGEVFADFETCLRDRPSRILAHVGVALCLCRDATDTGGGGRGAASTGRVTVRFVGVTPVTPMAHVKSSTIGKLISVSGYVVRASSIQPLVVQAQFECLKCGALMDVRFERGNFCPPARCDNTQCRAKQFEIHRSKAVTVDFQTLKIQEVDTDNADAGRVPRNLEVELMEDLVDACIPGDLVTVAGVVKAVNADVAAGKSSKRAMQNSTFVLYLEANSITNSRRGSRNGHGGAGHGTTKAQAKGGGDASDGVQFTPDELRGLRAVAHEPDLFEYVVDSICPSIYGHEHVKAGLVLALFGGASHQDRSKDRLSVRSDCHVLVVGDPGLGKSQMLKAVSQVAPRSVYVSANTTTATGLTVTVSKERGAGGDTALEAGALVLADQGVCCIDEFDKIGCDHHCLLEAMEQQQVSIAKSGVVASLSARCGLIAAANPVNGHYDCSKTISENLKMSSALLSRFDLVYILLDKPDLANDRTLSRHVMSAHSRGGEAARAALRQASMSQASPQTAFAGTQRECVVGQRVREVAQRHQRPPIDPALLRKYVMYARTHIHPRLTGDAATVLQKMYLKIREDASKGQSIPITTRQLEALVRLSQARARAEFREQVTRADAQDVVALMEGSLKDVYTNECGNIDFGRKGGMSLARQAKQFIAGLHKLADVKGTADFTTNELHDAAITMHLAVADFHGFLDMLNDQSYILKKGARQWRLNSHLLSTSSQSQRTPY